MIVFYAGIILFAIALTMGLLASDSLDMLAFSIIIFGFAVFCVIIGNIKHASRVAYCQSTQYEILYNELYVKKGSEWVSCSALSELEE